MNQGSPTPQIDVSKIPAGGGIAGALFAIGSMMIFLVGIPRLRYFLPAAIILGCAVALILRFVRRETPGKRWILSSTQDAARTPQDQSHDLGRNLGQQKSFEIFAQPS